MFAFKNYRIHYLNIAVLLCTIALCVLGYMVLGSAVINDANGQENMDNQLTAMLVGGGLILLLTLMDYHFILKLHWLIYIAFVGMLALVFTPLGREYYGGTRWLTIPGLGMLQPSEFAKMGMIAVMAWYVQRFEEKLNRFLPLLGQLLLFLIPAFLIFREPDLSTTLIFTVSFLCMLYASRISYKWIGVGVAAMIPLAGLLVWDSMQETPRILKPYMLNRLLSFFNPTDYAETGLTDQQAKAVMAIASGQMNGKGLYTSSYESIKNGRFLSAEDCDFIFAVVGEELGFVGCVAVIVLFALLTFLCFRTAAKAKDIAGRVIGVGVGAFIGLQAFVNIGVTCGILPNTGVVLPFFSAGMTSVLAFSIGIGLVMNVALQRKEDNASER